MEKVKVREEDISKLLDKLLEEKKFSIRNAFKGIELELEGAKLHSTAYTLKAYIDTILTHYRKIEAIKEVKNLIEGYKRSGNGKI